MKGHFRKYLLVGNSSKDLKNQIVSVIQLQNKGVAFFADVFGEHEELVDVFYLRAFKVLFQHDVGKVGEVLHRAADELVKEFPLVFGRLLNHGKKGKEVADRKVLKKRLVGKAGAFEPGLDKAGIELFELLEWHTG